MKEYSKNFLSSNDEINNVVVSSSSQISESQLSVDSETPSVKSDIRTSESFQAYLASKKARFEVYRRLAGS